MVPYAKRMEKMAFTANVVKGLFGSMTNPDIISFSGGSPAREALPVQELTRSGLSGSTGSRPDEALPFSLSFSCSFQHLLDVSQVAAVQVGDIQIPLE